MLIDTQQCVKSNGPGGRDGGFATADCHDLQFTISASVTESLKRVVRWFTWKLQGPLVRAQDHKTKALRAQSLASDQSITVNEVTGGHALLAFQLDFQQLKSGVRTASDQQPAATCHQFTQTGVGAAVQRFG